LLSSDRFYLRALEPNDLEFLFRLENDPAHWAVSNTVAPFSRAVLQQYLENAHLDIFSTRQLRLVLCNQQHKPIGTVDLYDYEPLHARAGVGIVVAPEARKQGAGQTALELMEEHARAVLGLHQLYCTISKSNTASLKLFKKAGFRKVGLRQEWLRTPKGWEDAVELQKLL